MRQLNYSRRKLATLGSAGVLLGLAAMAIPLDANIATGHVAGLYLTALYEMGPSGRWAFALASAAFFLFGALRLAITALGDGIALHGSDEGLLVRTITKHRQLSWADVISIDTSSSTYRGRTRRSIRVRARAGAGEMSLLVPISLLSVGETETIDWIAEARRLQVDCRDTRRDQSAQVSQPVFGRKGRRDAPLAPRAFDAPFS